MMVDQVKKVCVIGAGVMGAGIAAQVANAGIPVLLLDIVPRNLPEGDDRDAVAKGAVAKMLKTDPAPFMSKRAAKLVETGNIDDHLGRVAECDWIGTSGTMDLPFRSGRWPFRRGSSLSPM